MNRAALITLLPLLALAACDNEKSPLSSPGLPGEVSPSSATEGVFSSSSPFSPRPNNLLQNPSLETQPLTAWHDLAERSPTWHPFTLSSTEAHTGTHSAQLTINNTITTSENPAAILGIIQNLKPTSPTLPTTIAGHYKVTNWTRATKDQYLQAVIMCARPSNNPAGTNYPTFQLAIPLAGISEPPFKIGNRKFAFDPHNTPPLEPQLNEWIPFEFNLHDLYEHHWGFIPENSTEYKVFFEVRYDNKQPDEHPTATVYFDDLYLGTPDD